jgi:Tfp pilus assembly protein PilP
MVMKVVTFVVALVLGGGLAFAQAAPAAAPANASAAHPRSAPAAKASPSKKRAIPFNKKPSAPAPKPELKAAAEETKPAAAVIPPAPAVQQAKPFSSIGKRDPFLSVVQVASGSSGSNGCSGGKRCLIINQITLRGIVKSVTGWIAVVENPGQKTYFLRVNDPVLNGFVSRISDETVVFKESVVDALGHQSQREVVKHVSAPVV